MNDPFGEAERSRVAAEIKSEEELRHPKKADKHIDTFLGPLGVFIYVVGLLFVGWYLNH